MDDLDFMVLGGFFSSYMQDLRIKPGSLEIN